MIFSFTKTARNVIGYSVPPIYFQEVPNKLFGIMENHTVNGQKVVVWWYRIGYSVPLENK